MESNSPSSEYLEILKITDGDSRKIEKIRFDELKPFLDRLLQIQERSVPTRIYNPSSKTFDAVEEDSPLAIQLKSEIEKINQKFARIHSENSKYGFIR